MASLEKEFDYYIENQDDLVKRYNGKVIVIKGQQVIGAYDSIPDAIKETMKNHELGTFLTQRCEPGTDAYTMKFHSRVAFV